MSGAPSDPQRDSSLVVVSVGQCGFDNSQIRDLIRAVDPAAILKVADDLAETLDILRADEGRVRLVLVNRIFDANGASGLELIRTLKSSADQAAAVPLMLVSDLESAQASALAEGGVPGFGKSAIRSAQARDRVRQALQPAD